ncbi:hypothetical protein [Streptomyces antibioticus]|uniref:hypothetical protein n=1 Tax=Streptomyces antibioticus TaxID=1890 RepID=UPI0033BF96CC
MTPTDGMSQPSTDAQAVIRAADALTTQVRRIADALNPPADAARHATVAAALTAEHYRRAEARIVASPEEHCAAMATAVMRVLPGAAPAVCGQPGPWGDAHACVRPAGHDDDHEGHDGCGWRAEETNGAPAADEHAHRIARRDGLRNLLDRAARGVLVSRGEGDLLRQLTETEMREADRLTAELETADRIRAEAQRDRDQHAAVLAEVLAAFVHKVEGYLIPRRSAEADVVTLDRWRSVIAPTPERPWWQQVDEARAELEQANEAARRALEQRQQMAEERYAWQERGDQAQAAIERVRALVAGIAHPTSAGIREYDLGRQEMATAVALALTVSEQPATEV